MPSKNNSVNIASVNVKNEWLPNWTEEAKRRKELGLPEVYLNDEGHYKAESHSDLNNKESDLFNNIDNKRSIPSLVDGLRTGQRKVLFSCIKSNITKKEM